MPKKKQGELKNISFSLKKKEEFIKKCNRNNEKSYRAIPKLIFIESKKRVKKERMQQSISILIVRTISNRIRACVRTRDVMKSVENGWVCSGQQSVLPPLFTRKEVQLGSGAIHEPRERRRGEEEVYTHLVRRRVSDPSTKVVGTCLCNCVSHHRRGAVVF